ncbi:MAG: 4Fe-4S binding protein [Candidatus Bipolaricaulis sp.]|nr:4Fe-4S binding protein [Candidatus Bipolaricaulis sp.]
MRNASGDSRRRLPVLALTALLALFFVSGVGAPALAEGERLGQGQGQGQGLGLGRGSGQGEHAGALQGEERGQGSGRGYFGRDQLLKLCVMAGLAGLALGVVVVQGFRYRTWLLLLSVGVAGFYLTGLLCPLCSVQNVFLKWNTAYLLLVLLPVVLTLLVGRVYCGYVCPYGALQELFHIRAWAPKIPARWRRVLGLVKYAVLVYLVIHALVTWTEVFKDMTPFRALFALGGTPLTIGLAAGFAVLSLVLWRPFCEVLCPLGALLSLVSRVSVFRLEVDASCVSCGACTSKCPATTCESGAIQAADCYLCGECVRTCGPKSLRLRPRWRKPTPCSPSGARDA